MLPTSNRRGLPPEDTSPCMHGNVTMVDECEQGTPTSYTYVNKKFQMNSLHRRECMNSDIPSLCTFIVLFEMYLQSAKWKLTILNQVIPVNFKLRHNDNRVILLADKAIPQTTHESIMVECSIPTLENTLWPTYVTHRYRRTEWRSRWHKISFNRYSVNKSDIKDKNMASYLLCAEFLPS